MTVHAYAPLERGDDCVGSVEVREPEYPRVHLDLMPGQLDGLEPGDDVTIVLKGKVKGYRIDTEDSWGTGASVTVELKQSEIKGAKEETFIDSMIDEG